MRRLSKLAREVLDESQHSMKRVLYDEIEALQQHAEDEYNRGLEDAALRCDLELVYQRQQGCFGEAVILTNVSARIRKLKRGTGL